MFLLVPIIIEILFFYLNCKNIVLPFNKLTIGNFNGHKSIDDLITYNIYTNISIGTPPQRVAHFIDPTDYSFNFQKKLITYGNAKFAPYTSQYENLTNFWFQEKKSSTFFRNYTTGFCTDIYYFNNLNNEKIEITGLKYSIKDTHITDAFKCGIIGLNNPLNFDFKLYEREAFFINELKENGIVSEYVFSILYNDKINLLDTMNDTFYGKLIIGESPHIFDPDKYKKEDLVANQATDWAIPINNVIFNSSKGEFIQEKIDMQINIINGFIKGTESYRFKIEEIFFKELIDKGLCKVELFQEKVYLTEYNVFSCENNYKVDDYIKSFPTLYFKLDNNLEFIFTYNDLFQVYNDRIYFMIIFRDETILAFKPKWVMGEIFLRKYLTLFNYETREILFYRNQVEQINTETKNKCSYDFSILKIVKIVSGIIFGLIIIFILFLLYRKNVKKKKIIASELEDREPIDNKKEDKKNILLTDKNI